MLVADKKHEGSNHDGGGRSTPYGLARTAPTITLVDVAKQIQDADEQIALMTGGKLRVIADQIEQLQRQAQGLLEQAKRDLVLHRASCAFERVPGQVYHLYEKANGTHVWSLLSVEEWGGRPPHAFRGSYRLEPDQSWTPIEEIDPDRPNPFTGEVILDRLLPPEPSSGAG